MKKTLFFLAIALCFCGCSSHQSNENKLENTLKNDEVSFEKAAYFAQKFVEQNVGGTCIFKDDDIRGEEMSLVKNRYEVRQMFSSDADGSRKDYAYKIYVQYFGGDCNNIGNWDYGVLTVEKAETGEQKVYNGKMKERDLAKNSSGGITANGIVFDIIKQNPGTYINLSYTGDLSREEIASALTDMHKQLGYWKYQLFKYPETQNPTIMYMTGDMAGVWDYSNKRVHNSVEDYLANKGTDLDYTD